MNLPHLLECNNIPDIREEIPTPEIARHYAHLLDIQEFIPPLTEARTLLLIGRDLPAAHHTLDQRVGLNNEPFAQRLRLGWIIVGETCLGKVHKTRVSVNKTFVLGDGRPTVFQPCNNTIHVAEKWENIGSSVFARSKDDNKVGLSMEDKEFMQVMDRSFHKDEKGNWVAPLPFRENRSPLPNNRLTTLHRAKNLHVSLSKDPVRLEHMLTFMQRVFDCGHAEVATPLPSNEECWYLPIFGVYHPQKPGQIRAVFDSSAQYQGISLNSVLLSGPDLTNNLLDVLLRFRMEPVAISADIQQMFQSFLVEETHRNYLRFFWYRNNNPKEDLIEYRMKVHIFGNRPSPAIANYGLRRTAEISAEKFGTDVKDFIQKNLHVDDGLISLPSPTEAADLMKRAMSALKEEGNLRLHKIASNKEEVVRAFLSDDLAKDLKDLDLGNEGLPVQRSLGLSWDLATDSFTFRVAATDKPYTRRGILSIINSLYDPLGLVAPVTIKGNMILRKVMTENSDWDSPLPEQYRSEWESWKTELQRLQELNIRRSYMGCDVSLSRAIRREIHVYSDASEEAIAAVAYLKTTSEDGEKHVGIIIGKAKVAPKHGTSIPRLELCGALLAVEIYDIAVNALDIEVDHVQFHIDSKVVLGYINNRVRRFYMYVSNRIERILRTTTPEQWTYVPTHLNPADCATRSLPACQMQNSLWLQGPEQLYKKAQEDVMSYDSTFSLIDPENDKEVKSSPTVHVMKSCVEAHSTLGSHRFKKFSSWISLIRAITLLRHIAHTFGNRNDCKGWHLCSSFRSVETSQSVEYWIVKTVQMESFLEEYLCLLDKKPLPKNSQLLTLDPFLNQDGLICVGGRLRESDLSTTEKFPVIIPRKHYLSTLLVRHYHEQGKHQGRFFTESMIRSAGYWIVGAKRLISTVIHACVKCRRLRGKMEVQKMADLPVDRVTPAPPFTYTGVDVFGPWSVVSRRTRGGQANSKRWAVIFTCLSIRAIHIEVVEEMSSSSFINALRRFLAIRGCVKEFRSDRGTNFVGCTKDLQIDTINVEDSDTKEFFFNKGIVWRFNPPHSSHMGGVWERMIRTTRNILNSMLSEVHDKNLTHEVLTTLMCEVCAIVNARPIVAITSDPTNPFLLTPALLLTQKGNGNDQQSLDTNPKDLFKEQWRRVQCLAESFWKRWKQEYLQTLQSRRKWQCDQINLKNGDIVLLKDPESHRNNWPIGIVENAIPGKDGRVRKVELRVSKNGASKTYTRPVTELVLLLSDEHA